MSPAEIFGAFGADSSGCDSLAPFCLRPAKSAPFVPFLAVLIPSLWPPLEIPLGPAAPLDLAPFRLPTRPHVRSISGVVRGSCFPPRLNVSPFWQPPVPTAAEAVYAGDTCASRLAARVERAVASNLSSQWDSSAC